MALECDNFDFTSAKASPDNCSEKYSLSFVKISNNAALSLTRDRVRAVSR
jgi:hypothetical protein